MVPTGIWGGTPGVGSAWRGFAKGGVRWGRSDEDLRRGGVPEKKDPA